MRLPWMLLLAGLLMVSVTACATTETMDPAADTAADTAADIAAEEQGAEEAAEEPEEATDSGADAHVSAGSEATEAVYEGPTVPEIIIAELGEDATLSATGLAYVDDKVGDGAEAGACDFVSVDYTGRLPDGTEFDSSVGRAPFTFTPGANPPEVIAGWDEGILGMRVGGERSLVVPAEMAYGPRGVGGVILPNSPLLFDVVLQDVLPRPEMPEAAADAGDFTTTESGLQYAVLAEGEGTVAEVGDQVHVHYTGWLEDGTMFDSSLMADRCAPIAFPVGAGRVIRGWDEGVEGMMVGESRQLRIPSELGYGSSGSGDIPPDSTLIFDVQLVGVDKPFVPQ